MNFIQLNKLSDNTKAPSKAYLGDAAFDVVATSINVTKDYIEYGLGFSSSLPENIKGVIVPRSSISSKDLIMCNSPAQIDAGYRGEWMVRFKYMGGKKLPLIVDISNYQELDAKKISDIMLETLNIYKVGDRIAQVYFEEILPTHINLHKENGDIEVAFQKARERKEGAFGSSGVS